MSAWILLIKDGVAAPIDGYALAQPVPSHEGNGRSRKMCTPRSNASFEVHRKFIDGFHLAATV
jgi:hypothetical protein